MTRYYARVFLSIYSLSNSRRDEVLRLIRRFRPTLVYGYCSALAELARLVGDTLAEAKSGIVAVVTSETMQEHDREVILGNLASRVFNLYGSQEACHFVVECERRGWHIAPLVGIVEILNDNSSAVEPGSTGKVVVTGLAGRSMPLFRYDIGDSAQSTGYGPCECGLGWPTIGAVEGRSEDLIRTRDGRRIGMLAYSAIKDREGVRESQIIQRSYDRFEIKMVVDPQKPVNLDTVERELVDELTKRLGHPVATRFDYVNQIPRGARGKFKAVVVDFQQQ